MYQPLNFDKTQLRLHLLPNWLLNRLNDNNIPLSRLREDDFIPSILSGEDLIFYVSLIYESGRFPITSTISAIANTFQNPLILENSETCERPYDILEAGWSSQEIELKRLTKEMGCQKKASWRLLCGHDYDPELNHVKLRVVEDGINVYIVSEPCAENDSSDSLWQVLKILSKYFPTEELTKTKLYGLCSSL